MRDFYNGNDSQKLIQHRDDQNRRVPLPPRVQEEDHQKSEQEVNIMPAWMAKRSKTTTFQVDKPTKPPAFYLVLYVLIHPPVIVQDQC